MTEGPARCIASVRMNRGALFALAGGSAEWCEVAPRAGEECRDILPEGQRSACTPEMLWDLNSWTMLSPEMQVVIWCIAKW